MDKFTYTREAEIHANARADAIMNAFEMGYLTNKEYCDECMNIVSDLLNLDISKQYIEKRPPPCTSGGWIKERMLKEEQGRKKKVNYNRHISFIYRPTRFKC